MRAEFATAKMFYSSDEPRAPPFRAEEEEEVSALKKKGKKKGEKSLSTRFKAFLSFTDFILF